MARPKAEVDIEKLSELAELGLSQREIAHHMGFSESKFYELKKEFPEFLETIQKARARRIANCCKVISDALEREKNPKLALEYLKMHADLWRENKADGCGPPPLLKPLDELWS